MVATRNHPRDFQPPPTESPTKRSTRSSIEPQATESPTKRSTRSSTTSATANGTNDEPSKAAVSTQSPKQTCSTASSAPTRAQSGWSHTPSNLTLIWLAVSLPLVMWDTGYVLLRPYTLPGGFLHKPIWAPYEFYGTIDHVYSVDAYKNHVGWTAAQGSVNLVETVAYLVYLYLVYTYGQQEETQGRGAPDKSALGQLKALGESRTVYGRVATWAVVLAYSTAWLTFSKTVLYWLNEAFSGFSGIGHNDWMTLTFLWIIPNGLWLVFPLYMMYVFGLEILQGLELAAEGGKKNR